jgi:hypothetical protein
MDGPVRRSVGLVGLVNDKDAGVIMAGAHSLIALADNRDYNVYYASLTGERKGCTRLMDQQNKKRC